MMARIVGTLFSFLDIDEYETFVELGPDMGKLTDVAMGLSK